MRRLPFVVACLLVLGGSAARAQSRVPGASPPADPAAPAVSLETSQAAPTAERRWYGWQTLVPDAALIAVMVAEIESHSGHMPNRDVIPVGAFAFGVPAVHVVHRRWAHTAGSIAARVALPLIIGLANSVENAEFNARGMSWGWVGGMAAASVLDALFAWDAR